jgi:hypothetical protein
MTENERFGLVFTKTGSINSGTGQWEGVLDSGKERLDGGKECWTAGRSAGQREGELDSGKECWTAGRKGWTSGQLEKELDSGKESWTEGRRAGQQKGKDS